MAKGQAKSNREKKKPAKSAGVKAKASKGPSAYQQSVKPKG
jgi:hypothetical protein